MTNSNTFHVWGDGFSSLRCDHTAILFRLTHTSCDALLWKSPFVAVRPVYQYYPIRVMMDECDSNELEPSELGTKEYWDNIYERDKSNFKDHGDVGEIWFGEDSELRILRWLSRNNIPTDKRIIDLGCGNGMMLIELAREGFSDLTGVDYCESAIELSRSIIRTQSMNDIQLEVADLTGSCNLSGFDIVLDKGTFDAISLSPDDAEHKKNMYLQNVMAMLKEDGLFIITSCNWTENELIKQFASGFHHKQTIPTPTFNFGGKTGNVVSSVVFEKKSS